MAKQAEVVAGHIAKQDIVVTTALVQGRKAPILGRKRPKSRPPVACTPQFIGGAKLSGREYSRTAKHVR